jgi:trigger factor
LTVEITQVNSCRKNLAGEISTEEFEKELEKIAREYVRTVKIPGFRPGKVPTGMIRRRFEKELQDEASHRVIDRVWQEAIDANGIKPLEPPKIKEIENKPNSPLKFTITFEELPQLEVKDYKGVDVRLDPVEVKDEDLEQTIDHIRNHTHNLFRWKAKPKTGIT